MQNTNQHLCEPSRIPKLTLYVQQCVKSDQLLTTSSIHDEHRTIMKIGNAECNSKPGFTTSGNAKHCTAYKDSVGKTLTRNQKKHRTKLSTADKNMKSIRHFGTHHSHHMQMQHFHIKPRTHGRQCSVTSTTY